MYSIQYLSKLVWYIVKILSSRSRRCRLRAEWEWEQMMLLPASNA